jgi:hypothetical protein
MNQLKNYFTSIRNRFYPKTDKAVRYTPNYTEAREIGIIFFQKEALNNAHLIKFWQKLKNDQKHISLLIYSEKPLDLHYPFDYINLTDKDISALGEIKSASVLDFLAQSFDFLYCLQLEESPVLEQILQRSQAKCRVGKYFEKYSSPPFELMINLPQPEDEAVLAEQMLIYTQLFTKN